MSFPSGRCSAERRRARLRTSSMMRACEQVVKSSESLAKVQHPDADLLPVPTPEEASDLRGDGPQSTQIPSRHFEQTAAVTPQVRAESVRKMVGVADHHKLTTAGVFSSGESFEGVFNSRGLSSVAHADLRRNLDHHARRRLVRLAEGELSGCYESRSIATGRSCSPEGSRFGSSPERFRQGSTP